MRKFFGTVFIVVLIMLFGGCIISFNGLIGELQLKEAKLTKPSILFLELEGVIMDGKPFLDDLTKYAKEDDIKGVLIQVNSPGGVVGPSQELYAEIRRVREQLKKPVVVSCLGLAASGAYYAAVAADKIVTNPGSLLGSIGVIMEFANLERLYDWAKIKRYTIKTGQYKDSGAEYRDMREDEKLLFQEMANEVLEQFRKAIVDSRKLSPNLVAQYSDGRVITGAMAVKLGLADQLGTLQDARKIVGEMAGLGADPDLFRPPPKHPEIFDQLFALAKSRSSIEQQAQEFLGVRLLGQPLFLMPGVHP